MNLFCGQTIGKPKGDYFFSSLFLLSSTAFLSMFVFFSIFYFSYVKKEKNRSHPGFVVHLKLQMRKELANTL